MASASIVMLEAETFLGQNSSYLALIDAKKQLNRAIQHIPLEYFVVGFLPLCIPSPISGDLCVDVKGVGDGASKDD